MLLLLHYYEDVCGWMVSISIMIIFVIMIVFLIIIKLQKNQYYLRIFIHRPESVDKFNITY